MKIRQEQLADHLKKNLSPIYLVSGDETLLVQEGCDQIRKSARQAGFDERELLIVENNFNWDYLLECSQSLSLFGDKKLIELRISKGTPNDAGKKALLEYAQSPPEENVLLLTTPKLTSSSQRTNWYKQLEKNGVVVPIWPIDIKHLPQWIKRRLQQKQLQLTPQALKLLVERVEGNLLAASQEIDKLVLLYGSETIDENKILDAVNNNARFDVYKLVDTALSGDINKTQKICQELQEEGVEAAAALWAVSKEIQNLEEMSWQLKQGEKPGQVFQSFGVWEKRKAVIQRTLNRKSIEDLQALLQQARQVDLSIKGLDKTPPWLNLSRLLLKLSQ